MTGSRCVCHLCPGWWTEEMGVAAAWPVCAHPWTLRVLAARAAPPAPWRGGYVLGSGRRRAAGGPASPGSPEPDCSSCTAALLPSGGPVRTPTSATHAVNQAGGNHGNHVDSEVCAFTSGVQEKWSTFRGSTSCSRSKLSLFTFLQQTVGRHGDSVFNLVQP